MNRLMLRDVVLHGMSELLTDAFACQMMMLREKFSERDFGGIHPDLITQITL